MEPVFVPKLTVSFAIDLEVEYDSFNGRTPEEMAELLQDDLHDLLFEVNPFVKGVFSTITSIESND